MNDVTRLFVEAYVGLRLRLAVIQRLLGIQDWSALQTVLAAGFVANALRRLAAPILKRPGPASRPPASPCLQPLYRRP